MGNTIAFVTSNDYKLKEMQEMFKTLCYNIEKTGSVKDLEEAIEEKSVEQLVRKKTIDAFKRFKMPIIVEHTNLEIDFFNGLPGNITSKFLEKIDVNDICRLMKDEKSYRGAVAKTYIGFCDGKKVKVFEGKVNGTIAKAPRGDNGFGWDSIFIPEENNSCEKRYAEMSSEEKNENSMRKKAVDKLIDYLTDNKIEFYKNSNVHKKNLLNSIGEEKKELILFVGAGVPRNINLPTWNDLIISIGVSLGYEEEVLKSLNNDNITLAEYQNKLDKNVVLEELLNNFSTQRIEENKKINIVKEIENCNIYRLITSLDPKRVYTTNYDESIEKAFKVFGDENLSVYGLMTEKKEDGNKREIVKIHGDIKDVENKKEDIIKGKLDLNKILVLTEESYYGAYDDIETNKKFVYNKLEEDLKNPKKVFVFIGYGMGDPNINYFLYKKNKSNENSGADFYIFNGSVNPVQDRILEERGIYTIIGENPNPGKALENFLFELKESRKIENQDKKPK